MPRSPVRDVVVCLGRALRMLMGLRADDRASESGGDDRLCGGLLDLPGDHDLGHGFAVLP